LTSGKIPFRIFGQRMGLVSTWVSSTDVVGVKGWTGVKGVRDAKESPARCRFARWSRRSGCRSCSSLNGGVSYKACRHETSPCPGVFLWYRLWLMVFPVAEASLSLSGPAGQWLAGTRPKSMWQGFHCRL